MAQTVSFWKTWGDVLVKEEEEKEKEEGKEKENEQEKEHEKEKDKKQQELADKYGLRLVSFAEQWQQLLEKEAKEEEEEARKRKRSMEAEDRVGAMVRRVLCPKTPIVRL